ncbi:MAG TPA: SLC13 family permease [Planctomycetota bacterium]|nr:SLC13 family permease [Planctomycetota bacterium]
MTYEQGVVLLVLAGALYLFVTEKVPLGITGLLVIAVLGISGVVPARDALGSFSNQAFVLVGSLYVVSASLIRTGVVGVVERFFLRRAASGGSLLLWATAGAAAVSSVINNTSVVVLMMPVLLGAARRLGTAPSRYLMPVCFAATCGGMTTLIGTSTNVLVAGLASPSFEIGFLDFLPVGAGMTALGLLYLWFAAPRLLPARPTVSAVTGGRAVEYVTELHVRIDGPAVGLAPMELGRQVHERVRILQLVRGEEVLDPERARLMAGDTLILRGPPEAIVAMQRDYRLAPLEGTPAGPRGTTFAEVVITPASELLGRTLADVGLRRVFGVTALALQRRGSHLRRGIVRMPLQVGDTILVEGTPGNVERLQGQPGFLLLTGIEEVVALRGRAPVAIAILVSFVALAASEIVDITLLAIAAAAACLLTGCIRVRRAVRDVDWNVLGLLAGAVCLGTALERSGLAARFVDLVFAPLRGFGPWWMLAATYFATMVFTEFLSNSAAAALMVPVAFATAAQAGVSPKPFVFAVAYAASAGFATPIGYQTHAFIFGPGGYRFSDFLRVGLPLDLLLATFATLLIPVFFPF